jgi:hypothetical protein
MLTQEDDFSKFREEKPSFELLGFEYRWGKTILDKGIVKI